MSTAQARSTADEIQSDLRHGRASLVNRLFQWAATFSGSLILLTLAAVTIFLVLEAMPAFTTPTSELASEVSWYSQDGFASYVGPLVFGTLLAALIALAVGTPLAIGIALFISHYAPRRLAQGLGYLIDLLAAIPSVVYGLWGALVLAPVLVPVHQFLSDYLGWIPLFAGPPSNTARTSFTAGFVLAVMILPIVTAVCREVFLQTPRLHEEAALALGATRLELIQTAVLPFARGGIVSGAMLGLGRALGETMAVLFILSPGATYSLFILQTGQHQTIAANIAAQFPEANTAGVSVLIATGLVLFIIPLAVNMLARWIVARRAEFSGAN